jgi:hypothetical protein
MIGDRISDLAAAAAAGVPGRIRIDPQGLPPGTAGPAHRTVRDLPEALALLREFAAAGGTGGSEADSRSVSGTGKVAAARKD